MSVGAGWTPEDHGFDRREWGFYHASTVEHTLEKERETHEEKN